MIGESDRSRLKNDKGERKSAPLNDSGQL